MKTFIQNSIGRKINTSVQELEAVSYKWLKILQGIMADAMQKSFDQRTP
jgi:hypothetical protein